MGEKFDPHVHEAMFQMPLKEGAEPNTLGQIVTAGYMFKERVLRPCKAGVYTKKEYECLFSHDYFNKHSN